MPMSPRLLRPRASGLVLPSDADARAYVQAVNTADGQPLEAPVVQAIDAFVIGCKADGIWSAIQASCILMGARTLAGALTPLKGSAPTNNGPFVAGDYVRGGATPGLIGNGSTKFLDLNRADNADGQNDVHRAVWATALPSTQFMQYIGGRAPNTSTMTELYHFNAGGSADFFRCRSAGGQAAGAGSPAAGFKGMSRSASGSFSWRTIGQSGTITENSVAPSTSNIQVFAVGGSTANRSNARIAFFSAGSALTLTSLESRVSTLVAAMASVT